MDRINDKVLYGALSAATTAGAIAVANLLGYQLDPGIASALVTAVYGVVAYMVPERYRRYVDSADQIAQVLAARHPELDKPKLETELRSPDRVARLIESGEAVSELARVAGRWIR